MKIKFITLTIVLLLSACSKEIKLDQLQTRGNLVYEVNATSPFTGTVKEQYDNGQVKLKSTYKKGEKNGTHVEYYKNGELKFNANYKSGKLEGKYEEYLPNQILKKSGELVNGVGSEFHYNKNSELYKTISYENHVVIYEKFENVNESYAEIVGLSDLPYHQEIRSNLLSNTKNYAAQVLGFILNTDQECFDNNVSKTFYYPNGKIKCSITVDKSMQFYLNGNKFSEWGTPNETDYFEETFTISGESCGRQTLSNKGKEHLITFNPDCSIYKEYWYLDGEIYLSKYHNQERYDLIKNGHFVCANSVFFHEGENVDCLNLYTEMTERQKKAEEEKRKLDEEKRKLAEEKRKLVEEKKKEEQQKELEVKKYEDIVKNRILDDSLIFYFEENYKTLVVELFFTSGVLLDWNFKESSGNSVFDQSVENALSSTPFIPELKEMPDWLFDEYFEPFLLVISPKDIKNKANTQSVPIPVHVPIPKYPMAAMLNETGGYAIVAFTITKKGKVKDLALIEESLIQFGKSAMKAAKGLRYDPILLNGKPQEVRSSYKYIFKVER